MRIVSVRNLAAAFEQIGGEQPVHEIQVDDVVLHARLCTMPCGERDLAMIVLRAVIKAHRAHNLVLCPSPIQRRHGIHSA